jgi:hypothetical protein
MATPKPGEIRCPTCHRSTPPAAFCTQCGSAIPSDARIRPRGMNRDELQDRIRARRSGTDPYRRGGLTDEGTGGYQRYQREPDDSRARRASAPDERRRDAFEEGGAAAAGAAAAPDAAAAARRPDITRESDDWMERPSRVPPGPSRRTDDAAPTQPGDQPAYVDHYDDDGYDGPAAYPYEYDEWDEDRPRRSGAGALAILGFLALGVLALLGGAVLAGVFNGDRNVGGNDPTLTPSPSLQQSTAASVPAGSVAPSAATSAAPSGQPAASGEPVVFPDGFTAQAQPCLPGTTALEGCGSNGARNSGAVDVWVGFENGTPADVVGATLVGPDGATMADGSIDLARINCVQPCRGYTRFPFSGLGPGTYEVRVTRNGDFASMTSFEVE